MILNEQEIEKILFLIARVLEMAEPAFMRVYTLNFQAKANIKRFSGK